MAIMRSIVAVLAISSCMAFHTGFMTSTRHQVKGRSTNMVFGLFKKESAGATTVAPKAAARPNINSIKTSAAARPNIKSIKAAAPKAKAPEQPTASINPRTGRLQGYFTNDQLAAFKTARREVPSNAPNYWAKIAARVPGQTPETCKAMANQLLFEKAAGTQKNFFGEMIEVKEPEMYVDENADFMKRLNGFFGKK